ncbi:MAG: hypothetical protein GTN82_13140, partial [Candidatus Aminicenantes bacterium]|nr:hypothetical protein [Candidatus Aminicenantes bacterium]NIO81851.1 hypothetical protein [Candidatus Aminicenantes bacterium]NIQ67724.1 hypothetical protein [Candidatus Aminicenantes bacterium]NIR06361.1 hypothetical protein [Candidatus Aminicenantes bacterium]
MKKTCLIIFVFFLLASFFPVNIRAQENPPNKIGINIGSHLEYFDQAAETVGPGGWITIMPQSLSPEVLNPLFERHPEVNVIIRTHYPQTVPSPSEAASLVASLGNINTQNKIFIMPWNEPNLARECGGVGNETNPGDSACAPQVTAYTDALFAQLGASGLLHTKIEVLSPMINQSAPNFAAFVDALGGGSFYRQFYGVSMNLYNFQEGCPADNLLCKPNPLLNPIKYREILAGYGVGDMKVFGIETGVVIGHPIYDAVAMFNFLTQAYESWVKDPNFIMASPYIYDPEIGTHPMWLWGSAVEEFIEFLQDLSGHPIYGEAAEDILKLFEEWLQEKLRLGELVLCDDGSYAPSLDLC